MVSEVRDCCHFMYEWDFGLILAGGGTGTRV